MPRIFTMEWLSWARSPICSRSRRLNQFPAGRTLFALFLLSSNVYAQDDRATARDKHHRRPGVVTPQPVEPLDPLIQGEASLCVMVEGEQGVFLVHESAVPVDDLHVSPGYLAYWKDEEELKLYVYGRLLFEAGDVGLALRNLERDLEVQFGPLVAENGELAASVSTAGSGIDDPTVWSPASYEFLLRLMGFDPEPESNADSVAGVDPEPVRPSAHRALRRLRRAGQGLTRTGHRIK